MTNEEYVSHLSWEKQQDEIINKSEKYQNFCKEVGALYDLKFNAFADWSKHGRIKINGQLFHLSYYANNKVKMPPLEISDEENIRKFLKQLSFSKKEFSYFESFEIFTTDF